MAEAACDFGHEEQDRHTFAETIEFNALLHRIRRFKERDDYFHASDELALAYDDAEAAGQVVIDAYIAFKKALKHIADVRALVEQTHKQTDETHRNLATDAFRSEAL